MGNTNTKTNTNTKEAVREFVRNNLRAQPDPDAIPRMYRMLLVDKSITDIDVKDSDYTDYTALHYQAWYGTTRSVAWLLQQDPPPDVNIRSSIQHTPLMFAACADEDPEGKVRILLEHGADRDLTASGYTALSIARVNNKPAAVTDVLENYRPDVSR